MMQFESTRSEFSYALLQVEMKTWQEHNFPGGSNLAPVMGLFEETGEFEEATDSLKEADAIADTIIFAADACNRMAIALEEVMAEAVARSNRNDALPNTIIVIGRLAHSALKCEQKIRGDRAVHVDAFRRALIDLLHGVAHSAKWRELDLRRTVYDTWTVVRKRDWKKDPVAAGGHA